MRYHLLECEAGVWFRTYAPFATTWSQDSLDRITTHLEKKGLLDAEGWTQIRCSRPCTMEDGDKTFSHINQIAREIADAAMTEETGTKSDFQWATASCFCFQPRLENPGYVFLPDFPSVHCPTPAGQSRYPEGSTQWTEEPKSNDEAERSGLSTETFDSTAIGAFNAVERGEDMRDNESDLTYTAAELLFDDPRRRFVPGITVEKNDVRFWMFSRSHIAVSKVVNLHARPKLLITFLLYIMFGSSDDRGFDDTVERVRVPSKDRKVQYAYRYTCRDLNSKIRVFQTTGDPIAEGGAHHVISHANRVWVVREVKVDEDGTVILDDSGDAIFISDDVHALKDFWPRADARLEGEIQNEIFSALKEDALDARKYFLTILLENVVESHGNADITPICLLGERTPINWTAPDDETANIPPPYHNHSARKHVRIVFKDCGQCMHEIRDLRNAFRCLQDCAKALFYMKKAGFVHRDVSAGNCYYLDGSGKLGDLEYAKRFGELSGFEPRTGTPDFMAVEPQLKKWLFMKRPPQNDKKDSAASSGSNGPDVGDGHREVVVDDRTQIEHAPEDDGIELGNRVQKFAVHFLHDVESLYWLYLWFIHFRIPFQAITVSVEEAENVKKALAEVDKSSKDYFFCGVEGNAHRMLLIDDMWSRPAEELEHIFKPFYRSCPGVLKPLYFHEALQKEYINLQQHGPRRGKDGRWRLPASAIGDTLYDDFTKRILAAENALPEGPQLVTPIDSIVLQLEVLPREKVQDVSMKATRSRVSKSGDGAAASVDGICPRSKRRRASASHSASPGGSSSKKHKK